MRTRCLCLRSHGELMHFIVYAPCQVMHAADAPRAAARLWRLPQIDDTRRILEPIPGPAVAGRQRLEPQCGGQKRGRRCELAFPQTP